MKGRLRWVQRIKIMKRMGLGVQLISWRLFGWRVISEHQWVEQCWSMMESRLSFSTPFHSRRGRIHRLNYPNRESCSHKCYSYWQWCDQIIGLVSSNLSATFFGEIPSSKPHQLHSASTALSVGLSANLLMKTDSSPMEHIREWEMEVNRSELNALVDVCFAVLIYMQFFGKTLCVLSRMLLIWGIGKGCCLQLVYSSSSDREQISWVAELGWMVNENGLADKCAIQRILKQMNFVCKFTKVWLI